MLEAPLGQQAALMGSVPPAVFTLAIEEAVNRAFHAGMKADGLLDDGEPLAQRFGDQQRLPLPTLLSRFTIDYLWHCDAKA